MPLSLDQQKQKNLHINKIALVFFSRAITTTNYNLRAFLFIERLFLFEMD